MCKLFIAPAHTLRVEANGEAPLFITHLGHTKIFFFFPLVAACTVFFPFLTFFLSSPPPQLYFITSQNLDSTFSCCTFCLTDQLVFLFLFLFVEQDLFFLFEGCCWLPFFLFLHSGLSSSFCYVRERTEAITQCALCPTKRLVQQVAV